jgi:peptidyl-prolyl cis-trans isomerase C
MTQPLLARTAAARALTHRRACAVALLAGLLSLPALTGRSFAQEADPVVARVNGADIRASDVAIAEEDLGASLGQQPEEAKRDSALSFLTDMTLIAKAAEAQNLANGDDFKRRLAYFRSKILMEMLLQRQAKSSVTDEALRKLYDDATSQMKGEKEVRARHILVETEDEAKAILAELKKGGDFAEIAKQKSKDPSAAAEGGDLGYFTKDQMVPEFSEVAFKLEKGQLSDPVKSQFGWHIIKVEDKRDRPVPEFDKVKDQLETYLQRRAQAELITKLRTEGKVERLDKKPDAPAPEQKK